MSESPSQTSALRRHRASIILLFIYVLFFSWYTSFGGPLTDEEIARYDAVIAEFGRDEVGRARLNAFMRSDTGDDFAMFNAIDVRDTPVLVEGVEPGDTSSETGETRSASVRAVSMP